MHTGTLEHAVPSLQPLILPSLYSVAPLFQQSFLMSTVLKILAIGSLNNQDPRAYLFNTSEVITEF